MSSQSRGILLAASGASLISFDGLLIRLQSLSPAGVTFWRGLLTGISFAVMAAAVRQVAPQASPNSWSQGWPPVIALAALMVLGTLTWVFSLTHTTVAHTLLIVSSSPIATGILARFILSEHLPTRTWLAGLAALVGVVVVVFGGLGNGDLQGDIWAVANTGILALTLIVLRRYQRLNRLLALALSGFVTAIVFSPWGLELPSLSSWPAAALDGLVVVPGGLVLVTLAPRYLPAAEVGLLLLLETILAPLWVLLALGEALTPPVVFSAAIILGAITVHSVMDLREQRTTKAASEA